MTTSTNQIAMPEAGTNEIITLATDKPVMFDFTMDEVANIAITDSDVLVFTFNDGQTLAIQNYAEFANSDIAQEISLSDGQTINLDEIANTSTADVVSVDDIAATQPAAGDDFSNLISKPANADSNNTFEVVSGQAYVADFNTADVQNVERMDNGDLVLTFKDGSQTILVNFDTVTSTQDIPEMTLADGSVIKVTDLLTVAFEEEVVEEIVEEVAIIEENPAEDTAEIDVLEVAKIQPRAGEDSLAAELAAIEPAAGDAAAAGPLGGSNNFGSSVLPIGLDPALAVGPIGPTELAFDIPEINNEFFFVEEPDLPPVATFGGAGAAADGAARVYEDGTVFVPITATLQGDTPQILTVTLTGIDASWQVQEGVNNGTYDASTGTWTITLPQGQNYSGGLTFTPPANSDVDMTGLTLTASASSTIRNNVETDTVDGVIVVDAVADDINLNANNANGTTDQPTPIDISASLTDTDGSEEITEVLITNVPNGFSFNAGTDNGNGTWTIPVADLSNLTVSAPADYSGSVTFGVEVTNEETVTDTDFDFTNNENVTKTELTVVYDTPPTVTFGGEDPASDGSAQVYEDGSVFVPITATLQGNTDQQLTVTVTGVPSDWTVTTGANNGTYDASTGTWTITLPENTNYDGGLTFAPPADSDVDLDDLTITATATNTDTGEGRTTSTDGEVIVDAVADTPDLDAGTDAMVEAGESVALDITTALNDTDGSESLGPVTISGVPNGYTLSAGNNTANGTWVVERSDLNGLMLNTPKDGQGAVTLTVSVTTTERVTDEDFDFTNNEATATETITVTVDPDDKPVLADSDEVVVDESDLDPTDDASSTITANFGNDAPGTYTVTGENTFSFTGQEGNELTSNGNPVTVEVSGNSYIGTADGEEVFRLDLNENTGNYEFTLSGTLDHGDQTDPDDTIELKFGVTATDSDNDTDTGFITIDVKDDGPVARDDNNECTIVREPKDYNIALVLDVSGSMSKQNGNEIAILKQSVSNLLNQLGSYDNGQVRVFLQPFSTNAEGSASFTVTNADDLQGALDFINGMNASGGTNYEAPLQQTIAWMNGDDPISGADNYTYFVSDGNPTRYQNDNGKSILVGEENADVVMDEISGGDGTDEITMLQNVSKVISVGIGLDSDALSRLSEIDSEGNAVDVQDPANDLDAAFLSNSPVSGTASGNVITGENGGANAADDLSEDITNTVTAVSYNGNTVAVDPQNGATIEGDHGVLTISADGSYTYVENGMMNGSGFLDQFKYTLTDGDGDTSTANLNIRCEVMIMDKPPVVTFGGADGAAEGAAEVYEDGTVFVPITATLMGETTQQLTVTLTGVPSSWTVTTGANNGSYSNGTWTITLPKGENYNGGLTFTPPADSDVDLDDLKVTASAKNVDTDNVETSSTDGEVIVDAVADQPNLDAAANIETTYGSSVDLDISASLNDTDGSESLSVVTISGVPAGYSLNAGSEVSNGVWEVSKGDLNGLQLNTPAPSANNQKDDFSLTVSVTAKEDPTDDEFDLTNNEATATETVKINVGVADTDEPVANDDCNVTAVQPEGKDYNISLVLDVSNSMGGKKLDLLKASVTNLLQDLNDYTSGQVKVNIVPFGTVALASQSFSITNNTALASAIEYVNGLQKSGGTNYEDAMEEAIAWLEGSMADKPIAGAEAQTYFVSDGDAQRFNNEQGVSTQINPDTGKVTDAQSDAVLREVLGDDGSNEVAKLQSLSKVIAVGIGMDDASLNRLGQIDSSGSPVDVQDPKDLEASLSVENPVNATFSGNVITGENGGDGAADDLSADGGNKILAVSFNGNTEILTANGAVIQGAYGRLEIKQDGSYVYTVTDNTDLDEVADEFSYVLTDRDGDTSTAKLGIGCCGCNDLPPEVTFGGAGGAAEGSAKVYEDGTVFVPITATLMGETTQQLTVTLTGVPSSWTVTTGANNGSYSNGTWTITLPKGENYNGGLTFTPPADSDVDLDDLKVTASAKNVGTGNVETSSTDGEVIVDAVADQPNLDAADKIEATFGSSVDLDISASLNDTDGSESLSVVTISGVPSGYSLSAGNQVSKGVWEVSRGGLNGLKLNTPAPSSNNKQDDFSLTVSVTAKEHPTDDEFNLNNNKATETETIKIHVGFADTDEPVAKNDVAIMYSCDYSTIGNVITAYNQSKGADKLSNDAPNKIAAVYYDGVKYEFPENGGQSIAIDTEYGSFYMHQGGSYTYVTSQSKPKSSQSETFSYDLVDVDGDVSRADLQVKVVEVDETLSEVADYRNQGEGQNFNIGGKAAYKTDIKDGALIFGYEDNDVLVGNNGDDTILSWIGNDILYGGAGNDNLQGEQGNNTLIGGKGADTFVIYSDKANDNNYDTIRDFSTKEGDVLSIENVISGFDSNDDIGDFVRLVERGNNVMVQINADGKGSDFYNAAQLNAHSGIDLDALDVYDMYAKGHIEV